MHLKPGKFTAVEDTPENNGLAANKPTVHMPSAIYGEPGKFTVVEDTPENNGLAANKPTVHMPSAIYGEPGKFTSVFDTPENNGLAANKPTVHIPSATYGGAGDKYVAIYDYVAADEEEVSFNEGDLITDVTVLYEGLMEGRVERTGNYGIFFSNYVERV